MKKILVFLMMLFLVSSGWAMELEQETSSLPIKNIENTFTLNIIYDFVQWWSENQKPLLKSKSNQFALHQACKVGNFDQVQKLIAAGCPVNGKDECGDAPIHKAVNNGFTKITRYLLEKGAAVNEKDANGQMPLGIVNNKVVHKNKMMKFDTIKDFDTGFIEMVSLLVENGATVNIQNEQKRTILNTLISLPMETDAKKQNCKECVELLLHSGAKVFDLKKDGLVSLYPDFIMDKPEMVQLLSCSID